MLILRRILSFIAILFGFVTVIAGTRVLVGANPGYDVFLPLLIYNTVMGVVYVAAGIATSRSPIYGRNIAAAISGLNILVLVMIGYLYAMKSSVAVESISAMTFRTFVWLVLFFWLAWICHRNVRAEKQHV